MLRIVSYWSLSGQKSPGLERCFFSSSFPQLKLSRNQKKYGLLVQVFGVCNKKQKFPVDISILLEHLFEDSGMTVVASLFIGIFGLV